MECRSVSPILYLFRLYVSCGKPHSMSTFAFIKIVCGRHGSKTRVLMIIAKRTSESRFPQSNDPLLTAHRYRERNNHTDEPPPRLATGEELEISVGGDADGARLQPLDWLDSCATQGHILFPHTYLQSKSNSHLYNRSPLIQ
jgi:hypothetical protein